MGYVESVNIAIVRTGEWTGRIGRTGLDKRPSDQPLVLDGPGIDGEGSGVVGDTVADTLNHGGPSQAVYAFDVEELVYWSAELDKQLTPGSAGENLTLAGCDSSHTVVGQRWQLGSAILRVTTPRIPCRVFAGFWDTSDLVKRFTARGLPGAYLAVEQRGVIAVGDVPSTLSTPDHGVTIADLFAWRAQGRRDLTDHVTTAIADLPDKWVHRVTRATSQAGTP